MLYGQCPKCGSRWVWTGLIADCPPCGQLKRTKDGLRICGRRPKWADTRPTKKVFSVADDGVL